MYLYDYHMHSRNSVDGQNSVMEMCQKAVEVGLMEIAVTDHYEPTEKNRHYVEYHAERHLFDVLKARAVYKDRLKIKFGLELGQPQLYPEWCEKVVESFPYDYVLGSLHKLPGDIDMGDINYADADVRYYCKQYLRQLRKLAQSNQFDCIGHFDLPKRYSAKYQVSINLMEYREEVEEILKILIKNGKGIEVNTSGLRQHVKDYLPNLDIVKLYRELGGEIITIGSDAHCTADVGKGIHEGIALARQAGFKYITVFHRRKPEWIKIVEKDTRYCIPGERLKMAY